MFEDIRKNKIKTGFIISGFILIITLILYYLCMAFNFNASTAIFVALSFSILSCWATYYNSDKIILSISKARPATIEEHKKIINILDGLMISSGLSYKPRLYIVEDSQPNAFATGRNPKHSIICLTTGLLEKLDYYELEGVVAHELAHVKNYDIRLSAVISVMVGFVVILSDVFTRRTFRSSRNNNDNNKGNTIVMIIGLIFLIISPIVSKIIQLAVSRRREYLADATAISFTRNPDGLISALRKISSDDSELEVASQSNSHMYIVTPLKNKRKASVSNLFSTHPGIEERIAALENLK